MKINIEKINNFFNNADQDIKDFVIKLFEPENVEDCTTSEHKLLFLDLGFFELEKDDDYFEEDDSIINFQVLKNLSPDFRKIIISYLEAYILDNDKHNDFIQEILVDDLKVIFPFKKWKKTNRKNKLENLNKN